jgi:hypothetical protein
MPRVRYSRSDTDAFYVYRTRWATIGLWMLLIVMCFGFGIPSILLYEENWGFVVFGLIFTSAGMWMLATFSRLLKKVNQDNGFLEWGVSQNGVAISMGIAQPTTKYAWSDIDSIMVAEKFIKIEAGEKTYSRKNLLVLLNKPRFANKSIFSAARMCHGFTHDGTPYLVSHYPKGEQLQVVDEIQRFGPGDISIRAAQRIEFDWNKKEVCLHED